ncbi:DNA polymerase III, subunit gamma and tau [Candidatus Roizmanbacteria bacterium RIFCSPHIGHO2_01_FULL_39_12c]|uniref:DNA polymerase III subunit gamma/tau n=1 Tax=Candidatus Roizmanbacteria bacterium RIFCSPHIGHO2_01_FULL_39_12c TaxID=1802031 RepID=A0A1F7GC08_9BACT|nr:MAG: DNA polymerase III, subunit gamma and tau [Candidatus Roizmanbacteria bacterium RIFCSPHIGHO2_01_FULL_39_12c]OGK47465.1 MAG: DNA polymerase III, subunit gamma and tau [Candidatus Roizmanbacteria bacterium RIFCSPLOWO2_01_FULL_40_13]
MYYLKHRPKTIEDLDNQKVKEIVKKILESKKIPHALLFIGQKGTGKTSTARIISKALNCSSSKDTEPCNKCKNCLAVDSFSSPDIIELDAASNRGIEDIKNLIRESNFYPMNNRYRIFIIDEAQMITSDAFNALLKTLEEPPESVIFILATTNPEKIPKTIQSRCSVINFAKAKKTEIISMLKKIAHREKLKIDEKLLELISEHSDHSFRDAAKILEELVVQEKLTYEEGIKFLGLLRENFLSLLINKKPDEIFTWIEEFNRSGGNFKNLIEKLLDELRILLLANNGIKSDEFTAQAKISTENIVLLMKLLTEAYKNLKITPIESLPLEIAVVEFYNSRNSKS